MRGIGFKSVAVAVAAVWMSASAALATDVEDARTLVESLSTRLITLITSAEPETTKRERFEGIMRESAAMPDIARASLGRPWRDMTEAQQNAYEEAFTAYMSKAYLNRLSDYRGDQLEVVSAEDAGRRGVYVKTLVRRPGAGEPPIEVEWRVMDRNGPAQVFDIAVEGVSLVVTQRNEFASLLESYNGDFERFIDRLEADGGI